MLWGELRRIGMAHGTRYVTGFASGRWHLNGAMRQRRLFVKLAQRDGACGNKNRAGDSQSETLEHSEKRHVFVPSVSGKMFAMDPLPAGDVASFPTSRDAACPVACLDKAI